MTFLKKISKAGWKFILCWILVAAFSAVSVLLTAERYEIYATFLSVLIFSSYIYTLKLFIQNFSDLKDKLWVVPLIYSAMLVFLSIFFSMPVMWLEGTNIKTGIFEAFYYCLITLTTVGYGEFHPAGYRGQILSSSMALVGTTHMIMFISILVSNLRTYKTN